MIKYKSFHAYLDKHLPGLFTIRLKNFFSFLPFVKPVNPQLIKLRTLVDRAKISPNSYDYLSYFETSLICPGIFKGLDSFIYSDGEYNALPSKKSSTTAKVNANTALPPATSVISAEKAPDYVNQVMGLLESQRWQKALDHFLSSIEKNEVIKLIINLLSQYSTLKHHQKEHCILYLVDYANLNKDGLKNQLFNELREEKDILQYRLLLQIKSSVYIDKLLTAIDLLGRQQSSNEKQQYGVQRDYLQVRYTLRNMRDGRVIYEIPEVLASVEKAFSTWKSGHSVHDESIQQIIDEIGIALHTLKDIIDDFEMTPSLKESFIKEEKNARANFLLMEERQEFTQKLRSGEIAVVSIQRLRELYPDEKSYQQISKQCHKFGITVFDALDPEEKKRALQEHNAMKFLSTQLG
ncbi:hypothetical protein [Legionella clemsonensis]|nr:hypothetical protein [Legionella clemsonensis]